jgi:Plavaka transposase
VSFSTRICAHSFLQTSLPVGASLVPVLLGSDKTHLTNFAGKQSAWPVYLSIGNIKSTVRNKPSHQAWVVIAYIPVGDFMGPKATQTALQHRLYHQCVEILLEPLVDAGRNGCLMVDPVGNLRHSYPRVAAFLGDLPEQFMLHLSTQNRSPSFIVDPTELGSGSLHPPRTKRWILQQLEEVANVADPENVAAYIAAAREWGLSGVARPFWANLPGYRPEICAAPDILHGLHRFWRDHILKWTIELIGQDELDRRVRVIQPIVGFRTFNNGVHHLKQWAGREDRELQRILVAVVAGSPSIPAQAMVSLRAFHDFLYLAQYRSHSPQTLAYMTDKLRKFHSTKDIFIQLEARKGKNGVIEHFNIPKLEALQTYDIHIRQMGTSPQFSTEIIETCHQSMVKLPFRRSNRRDAPPQMCRYMDRVGRTSHLKIMLAWQATNSHQHQIDEELEGHSAIYQAVTRRILDDLDSTQYAHILNSDRFSLAIVPHLPSITIEKMAQVYSLSSLGIAFSAFLENQNLGSPNCSTMRADAWYRFRIHIPPIQDDEAGAATRTVQAQPPKAGLPYGLCNCVLVHDGPEAQSVGINGRPYHSLTKPL